MKTAEPKWKKEDSSSFLARTETVEGHEPCVSYNSPTFLSPLQKPSPSLATQGICPELTRLQIPKSSSQSILNKLILPREISGSLFQVNISVVPKGSKEDLHRGSIAGEQTGEVFTIEPTVIHCFSQYPRAWRYVFLSFSWIWTHTPLCIWSSSDFILLYLKVFFFLVKTLFSMRVLV